MVSSAPLSLEVSRLSLEVDVFEDQYCVSLLLVDGTSAEIANADVCGKD